MNEYLRANRKRWNELTPLHARSAFYDLQGLRAGGLTLMPLEREEVGDVAGKSLLHLQCHFGLDTLSWARLGAQVTGVDFSEEAITLAQALSDELGIEADFICSDLYDLPTVLTSQFDIVFASYGVLCWLPDLTRWAEIIAHFLRPGGTFYIAEIHPFAAVFYDEEDAESLEVFYPYFHTPEPLRFEEEGSYAVPDTQVVHTVTYEWPHSLGDVINSLISAGLQIEFLHEFPYACYGMFPFLEQDEDGWWRSKDRDGSIPMTFSLKATK
ncbi:MAG: class I SAM-dependent methyltransferase [Anaerolineae bacterium]|jgi:SAM-dependent methyltransferase